MSVAPQLRASNFDEHIDKLETELVELRAQLANGRAGLEAIWNETRATPRDMRTKAIILLSIRAIALLSGSPDV